MLPRLTALSAGLLLSLGVAHSENHTLVHKSQAYGAHFDVGAYTRERPQAMGTASLFMPLTSSRADDLWFLDVRGQDREGPAYESNLGLGYRRLNTGDMMWGVHGYWDTRHTAFGTRFHQLVVGGEQVRLHESWHANAYIPVGPSTKGVSAEGATELRDGTGGYKNIWFSSGQEKMMHGIDVEYGCDVAPGLRVFGGVYGFHAKGLKAAVGPRVAFRYQPHATGWMKHASFEGLVRYDQLQRWTWHLGMKYRFWLGDAPQSDDAWHHAMVDDVRRDLDIVTHGKSGGFERLNHGDGSPVQLKIVENNGDISTGADVYAVWQTVNHPIAFSLIGEQTLTGGDYEFQANGQTFVVKGQGAGQLTGLGFGSVVLSGMDNTVEHIQLTATSAGDPVLMNLGAAGPERHTIHDVQTNGTMNFKGNTAGASLALYNNTVAPGDLGDSTPDVASVWFDLSGASEQLAVTRFENNTVSVEGGKQHGVMVSMNGDGAEAHFANVIHNGLTVKGNEATAWVNKLQQPNVTLQFDNAVSHNTFSTRGAAGDGTNTNTYGMRNHLSTDSGHDPSQGTVNFVGGIAHNQFVNSTGTGSKAMVSDNGVSSGLISVSGFHHNVASGGDGSDPYLFIEQGPDPDRGVVVTGVAHNTGALEFN